jgi:hypothetical protein
MGKRQDLILKPQTTRRIPMYMIGGNWDQESFEQLQEARTHIADVATRNYRVHQASSSENKIEQAIWADAVSAAEGAKNVHLARWQLLFYEAAGRWSATTAEEPRLGSRGSNRDIRAVS